LVEWKVVNSVVLSAESTVKKSVDSSESHSVDWWAPLKAARLVVVWVVKLAVQTGEPTGDLRKERKKYDVKQILKKRDK
jgi:hypothetical protein